MSELYKLLQFADFGDERGKLVVIEGDNLSGVPFDIKRVFYIYGSDRTVVRGQHANRNSEFVLVNVAGSSKVMITDGKKKRNSGVEPAYGSSVYSPYDLEGNV